VLKLEAATLQRGGFFLSCSSIAMERTHTSIKHWAEDDRPREKFMHKGASSLSDAELVAILLGSGNNRQSALELARDILGASHNNLDELGRCTLPQLCKFRGVGPAKAVGLAAALELGRRRKALQPLKRPKVTGSREAYALVEDLLPDLPHEEFWMACLDNSNALLERIQISKGGITGTVADVRIILRHALERSAVGILLFHNHPSRQRKPSQQDIDLTRKVVDAARMVDVKVLDHIIVAGAEYFSFADEGLI
jgi:DNA repair protein RadC